MTFHEWLIAAVAVVIFGLLATAAVLAFLRPELWNEPPNVPAELQGGARW